MSQNYDELIEQKRSNLNGLKQQMEVTRHKFVQDTATFMAQWFLEKAKSILKHEADKALSLDDTTLEQSRFE